MFKIEETPLKDLKILTSRNFLDMRGGFKKLFSKNDFDSLGLGVDLKESYFSVNKKDVVRGMHFQIPPAEHTKIVYVSKGSIEDVVLDIRKDSATYGKYFSIILSEDDTKFLYIPAGFAHGFKSLQDDTIVNYLQTSCYDKDCDKGISFDSFGFDWQIEKSVISERDKNHPAFKDFDSPFYCKKQEKILVTGATGFIGKKLCETLLQRGYDVAALVRRGSESKLFIAAKYFYCDSEREIDFAIKNYKPDIVAHLATLYLNSNSLGEVRTLVDSNIAFGATVLECMKQNGVKKILNFGTRWQHLEDKEYNPPNLYTATKEAFQDILEFYSKCGIFYKTLELCDTFGKGDTRKKIVQLMVDACQTKTPLDLSPGEQILDLASVESICDFVAESLQCEDFFDNSRVCLSGEEISLRDLGTMVERVTGKSGFLKFGAKPYRESEVMRPPVFGKKFGVSKRKLEDEIRLLVTPPPVKYVVSVNRNITRLPWRRRKECA